MSSTEIYTPGTELTHYAGDCESNQVATCVTVLTDGNVFITGGIGAGTIIKYVDWLILAKGKPLCVSTPIPGLPTLVAERPSVPIGTKFEWRLTAETYRIAVQTAKGVLQVKSVTDGGGEVHPSTCRECTPCRELAMTPPAPWARRPLMKTMFANEDAWVASLPEGGLVMATKG